MEICSFVPKSSNIEKTSSKGGIINVYFRNPDNNLIEVSTYNNL